MSSLKTQKLTQSGPYSKRSGVSAKLKGFANRLADADIDSDAEAFGEIRAELHDFIHYNTNQKEAQLGEDLSNFAMHKKDAIYYRLKGNIQRATFHEDLAEGYYEKLPRALRW